MAKPENTSTELAKGTDNSESPFSVVAASFLRGIQFPVRLSNVLHQRLPDCPPMKTSGTASSTRGPSAQEVAYEESKRLKQTVYHKYMIRRLIASVDKWACTQSISGELNHFFWMIQVHPRRPLLHLPSHINTEQDSIRWIQQCLIDPCLWILQARHPDKRFPGCPTNNKWDISWTSARDNSKSLPIPDAVLGDAHMKGKSIVQNVVLTMEFKTHNAMTRTVFDSLYDESDGLKGPVTRRFGWPSDAEPEPEDNDDGEQEPPSGKLMKLLVQVWAQMEHYGVNHAILSSYQTTVLFMRSPDYPGTLYHSAPMGITKGGSLLIALTAFFEHALGWTTTKVKLPEPYIEWSDEPQSVGVDILSARQLPQSDPQEGRRYPIRSTRAKKGNR